MQPKLATDAKRSRSRNDAPASPRQSQSRDPLEELGLASFARALVTSPEVVLAVTATMLAGIAGPDACLEVAWGPSRLPKLDLLTQGSDIRMQRLIAALAEPLDIANRRLAENMGRFDPGALDILTKGPFSSSTASRHADPGMRDSVLRRHADALMAGPPERGFSLLHQDLAFEAVNARAESLVHPQFLIRNAGGSSLKALVDQCHLRTALVVNPNLSLEHASRKRTLRLLSALMDGVALPGRRGSSGGTQDSALQAKVHAILSLEQAETEALTAHEREACEGFMWLNSGLVSAESQEEITASAYFFELYQQTAEQVLGLRRTGQGPMVRFNTPAALSRFETELRQYEGEVDSLPCVPGSWARSLPQSIFWTLAFMARIAPAGHSIRSESMQRSAFHCARHLLANHCKNLSTWIDAETIRDRCQLADRIVEIVTANPSIKFCKLVRAFNRQRASRFQPVIEALLEAGVLVEDQPQRFIPGSVDWCDARDQVFDRLKAAP